MDSPFTGLRSKLSNYYDFYLLEAMAAEEIEFSSKPQQKWHDDLHTWKTEVVTNTARAIRDYLYLAACGEARYAWEMSNSALKELTYTGSRINTYKIAKEYNPDNPDNIQNLLAVFQSQWAPSGYGGKKWLTIMEAVSFYSNWPDEIFIDHAADLQHNGGLVFDKVGIGDIINFKLDLHRTTLQQWLYTKANTNIIKKGNNGDLLIAATKTKTLLSRFFITRRLDKPDWVTKITTRPLEETKYTPPEFGSKVFKPPVPTGKSYSTTKSMWPCICTTCVNVIITCANCDEAQTDCICNKACDNCGNLNCNICYICAGTLCTHEDNCCPECQNTWNNCTCCAKCFKDICECEQEKPKNVKKNR